MGKIQHTISLLTPDEQSNYISLKEAALLTDYSPDYIGQLIRAGKIEGRQVYTNVSWVTTEKAVREYLASRGKHEPRLETEVRAREVGAYMQYLLYGVIGLLACILLVCMYILFIGIDRALTDVGTQGSVIDGYAQ